jgi:hypothetical protein
MSAQMSDRNREFLSYYEAERVEDQLDYYRRKAAWHGRRNDRMIVLMGLLMFVASVSAAVILAGWTWLGPVAVWMIAAAMAPALSSAVGATRTLYEHERNRERFQNTRRDLEYLHAFSAPSSRLAGDEFRMALTGYVTAVEELLSNEHQQWVSSRGQVQLSEPPESSIEDSGGSSDSYSEDF